MNETTCWELESDIEAPKLELNHSLRSTVEGHACSIPNRITSLHHDIAESDSLSWGFVMTRTTTAARTTTTNKQTNE